MNLKEIEKLMESTKNEMKKHYSELTNNLDSKEVEKIKSEIQQHVHNSGGDNNSLISDMVKEIYGV